MLTSGAGLGAPLESARPGQRLSVESQGGGAISVSSCQAPAPLSVRPNPECPQSGLSVPPSFLPRNQSVLMPLVLVGAPSCLIALCTVS